MRIFVWHGYLLTGTGSNEYTQALARTLQHQGHDVTVFCQDPHAGALDLAGARVVRPQLPGPLPVFVLDRYPDLEARRLQDLDRPTLDAFVAANVAAIRSQGPADLLICNHLLLGGPVGAGSGLPYVVKAHGSELEYSMRGNPQLCAWARESLAGAVAVVAGSEHVRGVVAEVVGADADLLQVIPPGVDTELMAPQPRDEALAALVAESRRDPPNPPEAPDERAPDEGNAARFARFFADPDRRCAVYVGKVSEEKGVPLFLAAARDAGIPVVVVGFGPLRASLATEAGPDVLFTGPLQHRHLCHLWPLAAVSVVPSAFPEAFGMVAAEAASCGCPPLVADHTGLAEIAAGLRRTYPPELAQLASFPTGDRAALADRMGRILALPRPGWQALSAAARAAVLDLWSWNSVAERVVALAR